MIYISKKQFSERLKQNPDQFGETLNEYKHEGKTCKRGEYCAIEGAITGDFSSGCKLIFQHIHFEII